MVCKNFVTWTLLLSLLVKSTDAVIGQSYVRGAFGALENGLDNGHARASLLGRIIGQFDQPVQGRELMSNTTRGADDDASACRARFQVKLSHCDSYNQQEVEWEYGDGDDSTTCKVDLPEPTEIACDHVAWLSAEGICIIVLASAGVCIALCFWAALSYYRHTRTIRLAQPAICDAFVAGVGVSCLSALTLIGSNTNFLCGMRLWIWSGGFDLAFGALAMKLWRVLSVVEHTMKFKRAALTTRKVQFLLGVLLVGDAAILSSWTGSFGGKHCQSSDMEIDDTNTYVERVDCITCCHGHFFAWIAFKAAIVFFGCYMSYRTRKIDACVAESGAVALTTYNLAVAGLLVAAVIWADANAQVRTAAEAVAIVLVGVGALCTILAPKLWQAKSEAEGRTLIGPQGPGIDTAADDRVTRSENAFSAEQHDVIASGDGEFSAVGKVISAGFFGTPLALSRPVMCQFPSLQHPPVRSILSAPSHELSSRSRSGREMAEIIEDSKQELCGERVVIGTKTAMAMSMSKHFIHETTAYVPSGGRRAEIHPGSSFSPSRSPPRSAEEENIKSSSDDSPSEMSQSGISPSASGISGFSVVSAISGSGCSGRTTNATRGPFLSPDRRDRLRHSSDQDHLSDGMDYGPALPSVSPEGADRPVSAFFGGRVNEDEEQKTDTKQTVPDDGVEAHSRQSSVRRDPGPHKDGWGFDPLLLALNGDREALCGAVAAAGGSVGIRQVNSAGTVMQAVTDEAGRRRPQSASFGARSRGSLGRALKRKNLQEIAPAAPRRMMGSSAAGSLVMFADTGTRLFCPHCSSEVAGCGFAGCSGSLVPPPAHSDDEDLPPVVAGVLPPPVPKQTRGRKPSGATWSSSPQRHSGRRRLSFRRGATGNDTFDDVNDSHGESTEASANGY